MNRALVPYLRSLLLSSLLLSACTKDGDPIQPEVTVNPFLGSWKLVKFQGQTYSGSTVWSFSDTSLTITAGAATFAGSYVYHPAFVPGTLDITIPGATPNPNLAIYKFVNPDTLVLKLMDGATGRATDFAVEQGYEVQELQKQ